MHVWQVPDRVGVLPDRQDVMQASLCPMQLVPQLVACDLAVPFMASVQSEQLSQPPPPVHTYSVLDVTAGRTGLHVMLDASGAAPASTGPPELLLAPLLDPPPLADPEVPPEVVPRFEPLLLPEP